MIIVGERGDVKVYGRHQHGSVSRVGKFNEFLILGMYLRLDGKLHALCISLA